MDSRYYLGLIQSLPWETHTHTHTHSPTQIATLPSTRQHRMEDLSGHFHGNNGCHRSNTPGHRSTFTSRLLSTFIFIRCMEILKQISAGAPPSLSSACGPAWESRSHTHTLYSFHKCSSDDKTFLHRLHMKSSNLLFVLMDVVVEPASAACRKCFQGFMRFLFGLQPLVNVSPATNTLTRDLWKWAMKATQWDKSKALGRCSPCFSACVCVTEREGSREKN